MDTTVQYSFRGRPHSADVYFSFEEKPYFIFLTLKEEDVIREFGEDLTIKTDLDSALHSKDSYPALTQLREAIFEALKATRELLMQKSARQPTVASFSAAVC